jgi:hypothetical protein
MRKADPEETNGLFHGDPAKALVMNYIRQLVADGLAQWTTQDNGDIQLRLHTGETFLLTEKVIVRVS